MQQALQTRIGQFGDRHRKTGWKPNEDRWHYQLFDWYRSTYPNKMGYYAVSNRCEYRIVVLKALDARYHVKAIAKVLLIVLVVGALAGLALLFVMTSPVFAIATVLAAVALVGLVYFLTVWLPRQARFWDWFLREPIFKTKRLQWLEPWLAVIIAVLAGLVIGAISGNDFAGLVLAALALAAMVIAALAGLFYVGDVVADKTAPLRSKKVAAASAKEAESMQMIKKWIVATAYSQQVPGGQDLRGWEAGQLRALGIGDNYLRSALTEHSLDWLIEKFADELASATGVDVSMLRDDAWFLSRKELGLLAALARGNAKPAMRYERKLARKNARRKFRRNVREMAGIIFGVLGETMGTSKKLVCPLAEIPGEKERVGTI